MLTLVRRWAGPTGLLLALRLILGLGSFSPPLAAAEAVRKPFALAAAAAEVALETFSDQADVQLVYLIDGVRGVATNPVKGDFAIRDALERLVAGTGLRVEQDGKTGAFVIKRAVPVGPPATAVGGADHSKENAAKPSNVMKRNSPIAVLATWMALVVGNAQAGQTATGTIEGRVFNPASGEYLHNAEVRVQGTEIRSFTESNGRYRIANLPSGSATLVVNYIGYRAASSEVAVPAGQTVTRDFELHSTLESPDGVVALGKFTVSADREGTAKGIMEQRSAMTIKNVVATDTFGAIVEGNIGDVLQYLPGMQVIYSGDVPFEISMSGMPADYAALMVDGVRTSGPTRSANLAAYSSYASDAIEVNKTNSAEMDADAPAGSVNMRSKSAFQRKGRFMSVEAYTNWNTLTPLTLGKMEGPHDGQTRPLRPSFAFDYSDVYLDGRLGVVLNVSETTSVNDSGSFAVTYNAVPTAANPAPIVMTSLSYTKGATLRIRRGGGLNLEYKLTPRLIFALRGQGSWEDARNNNNNVALTAARNSQAIGSNENVMIATPTTNNTNRLTRGGSLTHRDTSTHSFAPQLTYDGDKFDFDATFAYTRMGRYQRNLRAKWPMEDEVGQANLQLFGLGWTAARSAPDQTAFAFRQTSGPDLYVLDNWVPTSLANNIVRAPNEPMSRSRVGQINGKYTLGLKHPTYVKAGLKTLKSSFFSTVGSYSWTYVGPTGNRLGADYPVSVAPFDPQTGGSMFDRTVPRVDRHAIGVIQREHPEYFIPNPADATSATNLYPNRSAEERINSGYVMANTQVGRLMLQAGARHEITESEATNYERGVLKHRTGEYDDTFFSAAARYRFTPNLMAIASFGQSIRRPDLNSMSGVLSVNDTAMSGTLPNPALKPEHGDNYSIRLEQYFEGVGMFSVGAFRFDVTDLLRQLPGLRAEDLGLGDDYPGYTFTSLSNAGDFTNKGIELAYSQQLTFLPGVLRGLGVFANFNRFWRSNSELAYNLGSKTASGGVTFRYRRFMAAVRGAWKPETLASATQYRASELLLGCSVTYQLSQRWTATLTGRNITEEPRTLLFQRNLRGYLGNFGTTGGSWTLGVKGVF